MQGSETLTKLRGYTEFEGNDKAEILYFSKTFKRDVQIHLIIINTDALVEILDRQSKIGRQLSGKNS